MGKKHKVVRCRRLVLRRVSVVQLHKLRSARTTRVLPDGGSILLVCRFINRVFYLALNRGQFVNVTCTGSPKVITVGCTSFVQQLPTIHLNTGDALFITCV